MSIIHYHAVNNLNLVVSDVLTMGHYSPRASNTFNQVVEANRFEGVYLCRKVC